MFSKYGLRKITGVSLKAKRKRVASALLCLALILSVFVVPSVFASSATAFNMEITSASAGNVLDPLYVGELAYFDIKIDSSGLNISDILGNPTLTLYYDAYEYDFTAGKPASEYYVPVINVGGAIAQFAAGPPVINDEAKTVTWPLKDIPGGTSFTIPGNITMPNGTTPLKYPLELKAVLSSEGRSDVVSEITVYWKYDQKTPAKTVEKDDYMNILPSASGEPQRFLVYGGATEGGYITSNPDDTYPVTFTFDNDAVRNDTKRNTSTVTIVDKLPPGAVFDAADNIAGWTDDPGANTVTYSGREDKVALKLRFPGAEIGKDYTNEAEYTYNIENPAYGDTSYSQTVNANVQFAPTEIPGSIYNKVPLRTVRGSKLVAPSGHANRLAIEEEIRGDYWFWNSYKNTMKATPLKDAMISDDSLDVRLRFYAFNISADPGAIVGDAIVQYRVAGQSAWQTLMTITENDLTNHSRPDDALGDRAAFIYEGLHANTIYSDYIFLPEGLVVDGLRLLVKEFAPGKMIFMDVGTVLRDGEADKISNTDMPEFRNATGFHYDWVSDSNRKTFGTAIAYHNVVPYQPKFRGMKIANGAVDKYEGQIFTVSNRLRFYDFDKEDTIIWEGGQIIDLMPQGLEYIPGTVVFTNLNGQTLGSHFVKAEPTVIYDYNGTGMTALIWDLKGEADITWYKGEYTFYYTYQVKILDTAQRGVNTLYGYFHWPEYDKIIGTTNNQSGSGIWKGYVPYRESSDPLLGDINHSGTDDQFLKCELSFTYNAAEGIVAQKGVKGSYNSTYLYAPATGYSQELDTTGSSFKLDIINYSPTNLNKLTVFDVLPYVGDKALVQDQTGVYVDRLSKFAVTLTGPIVLANAKFGSFKVYYSTKDPSPWSGISSYETGAGWVEAGAVTNWGAVRAFKIELVEGYISPNERIEAILNVAMPAAGAVGDLAFNSYAINTDTSYLEAIKAGIEIVTFDVKIDKTSDRESYNSGQTVTYTLTVFNDSKLATTGTVVTDTIPAELTFKGCDRPYSYNSSTKLLTVNLGTLSPLQTSVINITCTVDNVNTPVEIPNTAEVKINEKEKDYNNNKSTHRIRVLPPIGSLVIRKALEGQSAEWGVDNNTVFYAKVWDTSDNTYLIFDAKTDAGGNYVCVGNNTALSKEEYTSKAPAEIEALVTAGDFLDKIPVTVSSFSKLVNLWANRAYKIEEVFIDGTAVPTTDNHGTDAYYWVLYSGNSVVLPANGTNNVLMTNHYEHGEGNLIIAKNLRGYYGDWGVDRSTTFYAQVFDVLNDGLLDHDVPLVFLQTGPYTYKCVGNVERLTEVVNGVNPLYIEPAGTTDQIAELLDTGVIIKDVPFNAGQAAIVTNLWVEGDKPPLDVPLIYAVKENPPIYDPDISYVGNYITFIHEFDGAGGALFEEVNSTITVINTYERGAGKLTISKAFASGSKHGEWEDENGVKIGNGTPFKARVRDNASGDFLTFAARDANGYKYLDSDEVGTVIEFSVNAPAVLYNMPVGAVCLVLEEEGINYTTSYDYGTEGAKSITITNAQMSGSSSQGIVVTNDYEEYSVIAEVEFSKLVYGTADADK
ncbi:MAG: DUF11 domain-containing protein, partial [Oscillospiraceae bacterium]|nr:DUF11 domain-containing protein [Oscillospiraceae bacterium]